MADKNLPDYKLLEACQTGNTKAFDILFKRYFNKLNCFALKHIKQQSVAEELIMDLMLKLWQKKDTFKEDQPLEPYLFKALKNAMIDHYRKKELSTISIHHVAEDALSADVTNETISHRELQKVYLSHLAQLSPQRKLVFEMSRHENLSYRQIAIDLNLSVKTVEGHISAALLFLRKKMNRYSNFIILIILFNIL